MGRSRYPRRGHRLAPATLRSLLHIPIPTRYLGSQENGSIQLCDLDESSWERFDEATCRALADEVVRVVGRAARMPMPLGDQLLPAIPNGMSLADLDLEVRTINCLAAAGIHERPQDLCQMTIEGVLALRGFWVKSLVDLLTSVEYATDHREAQPALRGRVTPIIKRSRVFSRYPRPGHRVAPATLREILSEPVPDELAEGTPWNGRTLSDLDERVWNHLSSQSINELARIVVSRVCANGHKRTGRHGRLPKLPNGIRLEDLRLENRTYNCLRKEGFDERLHDLGKLTVGDLLAIKSFGAKCLVDLLSSLEAVLSWGGEPDRTLTEEAEALANMPGAAAIHFSDPRLGPILRAIDTEANTVAELIEHTLKRRLDPPVPLCWDQRLRQLRSTVRELTELSLEEELIQIFSPSPNERDRQIIAEYYGWSGHRGRTLEELGQKHGLSRERIRQVCVRATKRNHRSKVFAPVLDRALAFIAERIPAPAEKLQAEFDAAGFSASGVPLETVRQAAEFLFRGPQFDVVSVGESRLLVKPQTAHVPRAIVQVAKRAVLSYGAATVDEVAGEVSSQLSSATVDPALITVTLESLKDFEWLDEKRCWFKLDSLPQYGLSNMIEKVLSVAGRIGVSRLRAAVARYRRSGRKVPPANVLLQFCRRMPGIRVKGRTVFADPPRDWRKVLAGVEAGMVKVLKEHGPVMERGTFEEYCTAGGMNRFSFNAIIMCSPVITQYGRSVYGLLGARVDRAVLESLTVRKSGTLSTRVLREYGHTDCGRVYLAYQLSKAAIAGGVITVPAAMKEEVQGSFTIRAGDGRQVGKLVSKNGCAWGLGPVLRAGAARPGDYLLIRLDAPHREATVSIGDKSIVQEGAENRA